MSLLVDIPKDVFMDIWTDWLSWKNYGALDNAFTNHSFRLPYFASLIGSNVYEFNTYKLDMFITWINNRKLRLKRILLNSSFLLRQHTSPQNLSHVDSVIISYIEANKITDYAELLLECVSLNKLGIKIHSKTADVLLRISLLLSTLTELEIECDCENSFISCFTVFNTHCHKLEKLELFLQESFPKDHCVDLLRNNPKLQTIKSNVILTFPADVCPTLTTATLTSSESQTAFYNSLVSLLSSRPTLKCIQAGQDLFLDESELIYEVSDVKKSLKFKDNSIIKANELMNVDNILKVVHNLTILEIQNTCFSIPQCIAMIINNCGSTLQQLELRDLTGLTCQNLKLLLTKCPALVKLKFKANYIDNWWSGFECVHNLTNLTICDTTMTLENVLTILRCCRHLIKFDFGEIWQPFVSKLKVFKRQVEHFIVCDGLDLSGKIVSKEGYLLFKQGLFTSIGSVILCDEDEFYLMYDIFDYDAQTSPMFNRKPFDGITLNYFDGFADDFFPYNFEGFEFDLLF